MLDLVKNLLQILKKRSFLNIVLHLYLSFVNIYNMFVLSFFLFFINFFSLYKKPQIGRLIWRACFFFLFKNAHYKFYLILNIFYNVLIIIFYSFLIFFFSFSCFFIVILLLEESFLNFYIFACNKALLFFFLNIFFYSIFFEKDFFFSELEFSRSENLSGEYDEEWEDYNLEFDNSDLWDDNFIENESENDYHDGEESFLNEFKKEKDYSYVEAFDGFEIINEGENFDDDEYEADFLENLYFFDRWLGLSNELLFKLYNNKASRNSPFSKVLYHQLTSNVYQEFLNKELDFLFYSLKIDNFRFFNFSVFSNYADLISCVFFLEKNNLNLSDSILLSIQVYDLEEDEAYENIYIASLSNSSVDKIRGFFNKFYVSNKQKLSFLSLFDLKQNFYINYRQESNSELKAYNYLQEYSYLQPNFFNINYKNFDKFSEFFYFNILNFISKNGIETKFTNSSGLIFSVVLQNYENKKFVKDLLKQYKFTLEEISFSFFRENSDLTVFQIQEIKNFLSFFFRFLLQEKFSDEDYSLINDIDQKLLQTGFLKFFFFSFGKSFSLILNFFFVDFLISIFNKFPNQNNIYFKNLIYQIKRDNDLILLLHMWKNFEYNFLLLNKDLTFYNYFRCYLKCSSFEFFNQDFFYSFNTILDESNELLMSEQENNHFDNMFDKDSRPLHIVNPLIRYYYLNNSYNERSLYSGLDGNFEYYFYLPQIFLKPSVSYKSIKYKYFIQNNRSIDYLKRKKLNTFVNSKKDSLKYRLNNYLFFYFTKVLFFSFDFKYWILRFIPFLFDVFKIYGYGGTFLEYNNKFYSIVTRKLYNIGANFFKSDYDSSQILTPFSLWENKFEKKPILIHDTSNIFPSLFLSSLSFDFALKFNIYFDLYREFEFLYFLIFLKKEINSFLSFSHYYKQIKVKEWLKFYKVSQIDSKLLFDKKNIFYFLFFDLCSNKFYKRIKYLKPISSDPVLRYFENEKRKKKSLLKKKKKVKLFKRLLKKRILNFLKWKKKRKIFYKKTNKYLKNKKNIINYSYSSFFFNEKEKEVLSIFFNKTWLNEFSNYDFEEDESWDELDFLQGGLFDFEGEEENLELLELSEYNTFVWDWQLNNWETVLNLFLDVDRFFNTSFLEDLEEDNNNYYTFFFIALFFWLYCRIMRFVNYNDSYLLPYILKYTKFDSSVSAYRFFFENMLRSGSGRSRILGENYVGVNRRLFTSFIPISYWVMYMPVTRGPKEFNKNFKLAVKSQFSLKKLKLVMFFKDDIFKTHLNYGKGFYSNESARFFKNSTLKWVLYGRLKRFLKVDAISSFYQQNALTLSLLKNFFLMHKNPRQRQKQKRRKPLKKRNNFLPILRAKLLHKFLGYNPLVRTRSQKKRSIDKFLQRLYRKTIIKYANKTYLTPYEYEVYYGGYDSFPMKVKRIFNIVSYLDENYLQYESRFRRFIGESLYFNILEKNFIDESGKKHYSSLLSDFFVYSIYNSIMRNNVQYRFDVRSNYKRSINKFPELVNFLYNLSPERRNLFLNKGGFFNLFFKYYFEFIGDDFLIHNSIKDKYLFNSNSFIFNNWFNFIYKTPFNNLYIIDKKIKNRSNATFSNFNEIFFSSDYGWDMESWLDFNPFDLDFDSYFKFFKYGIVDWIPFSGNLTLERMDYFINFFNVSHLSSDLIKRSFEEPEFDFRYYLFGEKRSRRLLFRELARNPNYYSVRDNLMPTYRFLYPKESWWTAFNIHTLIMNNFFYNHLNFFNIFNNSNLITLKENEYGFRKFRSQTYKKFYLEGLFNLGRQSVDRLEGENGYNLTLDYFTNANTQEFFDDTFNINTTNKSHYWFLGNSNFYLENKRQLWNIPTWIWAFILRRHFENPPNNVPNYILHYHIMPNFSRTNLISYKGKYFYNNRRYLSNPLEYTFEEIQFPSEEGFLGGVFVPALVHLFLKPFFYVINNIKYYLNNNILILLTRLNRSGDFNNRPDWLVNLSNKHHNQSLLFLKKSLYNTHLGNKKSRYNQFSDYPSDFLFFGKNISFFNYLDNIRRSIFFKNGREDFIMSNYKNNSYNKKQRDNQDFLFYFPFKPFFTRNNYFYFSNFLIYIFLYLFLYYFLWIPINYLTYSLNYWFDQEHGFDIITEDNISYREEFYYDLLNVPNYEIDSKAVFYDYHFRSPNILSDIDIFSFLFNINSCFTIDTRDTLEALQFQSMNSKTLQFYGSIIYTFLKWEYLDLFLLKIYDYNSLSYSLLDVVSLSKFLFYKDKMKLPLPENRAVFSEFLNVLTGYEIDLVDYIEEYNNGIQNKNNFFKHKNYKLFIKNIKKKQYLGDGVFIKKKKFNKKLLKTKYENKKYYTSEYFSGLNDFISTNIINENTVRNTTWCSVNFLIDNLQLMNICSIEFLKTEKYLNLLFSEKNNINLIYYLENLVFFPNGKWGFLKQGSLLEQPLQYKVGEQILPFYMRFFRSDVFVLKDVGYYENMLLTHLDLLNSSFINNNNNTLNKQFNNLNYVIEFQELFDTRDMFFSHRINNESNLSTEYMINLFFNFQQYLNQVIVHDEYKLLDNFIFNEHINEMLSLYSNELFSEICLSDLELFDWELIIEQGRDWLICYPNNLKVELFDLPNIYNYMYEYYSTDHNKNLDRNFLFLYYYEIFDYKFKLKNTKRKTFYNLQNKGFSFFISRIFAGTTKYWSRKNFYNEDFEDEIDSQPFLQPDFETDELLDDLEFPDKYTLFSKFIDSYQTDFFSSFYLFNNYTQKKILKDEEFIKFFILQYFNKNFINDNNQKFLNAGDALNIRLNKLSSNQLLFYNYYFINLRYKKLLLITFQNNNIIYQSIKKKFNKKNIYKRQLKKIFKSLIPSCVLILFFVLFFLFL